MINASARDSLDSSAVIPDTSAAATRLTGQVSPGARQTGKAVFILRQFNLHLAFVALSALGKNVQNQAGAVNDACFQFSLEIALLSGRKRMIENDKIALILRNGSLHLVGLAAADKKGRIGARALHGNGCNRLSAG